MPELPDFFQGLRLLVHLLTVLIVAGYCPDEGSAKRHGISLFAVLLAGGSACLGVSTALTWQRWLCVPLPGQVFLTLIFSALLVPVIIGRGNLAVLFPRKIWSNRP